MSWTAWFPRLRIRLSFCPIPTPTLLRKLGSLIRAARSSLYGSGRPVDVVDQTDQLLGGAARVDAGRPRV